CELAQLSSGTASGRAVDRGRGVRGESRSLPAAVGGSLDAETPRRRGRRRDLRGYECFEWGISDLRNSFARRAFASSKYSGASSALKHRRADWRQATAAVHIPPNGSQTTSP